MRPYTSYRLFQRSSKSKEHVNSRIINPSIGDRYRLYVMSEHCKVIFERGRYFIESGMPHFLNTIFNKEDKIIRYIPEFVFKRIETLTENGDIDSAVGLWLQACKMASGVPLKTIMMITSIVFHVAVAAMAIYAFISIL